MFDEAIYDEVWEVWKKFRTEEIIVDAILTYTYFMVKFNRDAKEAALKMMEENKKMWQEVVPVGMMKPPEE